MINVAGVLRGCEMQAYTTSPTRPQADFVTLVVQSGADAARLMGCICADGTRLHLFSVVRGSDGRLPYVNVERPDGTITKVPLAFFWGARAEVHRHENAGFDGDLWVEYARFLAKHLGSTQRTTWKLLLMDGCEVHLSGKGLGLLKAVIVVVLMFPPHRSHLLQPCDDDPFPKVKAHARLPLCARPAAHRAGGHPLHPEGPNAGPCRGVPARFLSGARNQRVQEHGVARGGVPGRDCAAVGESSPVRAAA